MMHITLNSETVGSRMKALGLLAAVPVIALLFLVAGPAHAASTFTVNSTNDYGDLNPGDGDCHTGLLEECTLRAAIQEANAASGADVINFDFSTNGVVTIAPASELPKMTKPVIINGYSQTGAEPNTKAVGSDAVLKIELSGEDAPGADGLEISAANSTIKGLAINRWSYDGIRIDGPNATGNKVTGNFIGTDVTGTQDLGNNRGVRFFYGSNNTIGGVTPAERNVISANVSGVGLGDGDGPVTDNRIIGNYIGTDASGTQDLGNSNDGVGTEGAPGTTIGGTTTGARNVISGNDAQGIDIYGRDVSVTGNYVGTDASGTKDLGNRQNGVRIGGADNNVGGSTAGARNVISGNDGEGVLLNGPDSSGNEVIGNYIGVDKTGTSPLGNSLDGVFVFEAPNNAIGGTQSGERNVISANGYDGVAVYGDDAKGNNVLSNSIYSNGEQGIDLGADGRTANDTDDADTGPNNLQNFPVLSSARKGAAGTITVRGTLNSTPNKTFTVQFFSNPEGTDEGKTLLGSATVSTNGSGDASFTFSTKKVVTVGQNVTATATGLGGNTSEFSAPRRVVAQ